MASSFKIDAQSFRFVEDRSGDAGLLLPPFSEQYQQFRHSCLEVSSYLTPQLETTLLEVLNRCGVDRDLVACFVNNDPSINASCRLTSDNKCILVVSSGACNQLSNEEVMFVLGHEVGHFIFHHVGMAERSEEDLWLSRAAEISSDRIGLLAAGSISPALRTLVKSLSGLQDEFIRFDIANLLGDMNSSKSIRESNSSSTHPSLIVRARALLHWDMIKNPTLVQMKKINQRISNDMYKFVDRGARTKLAEVQNELSLWKLVSLMSSESAGLSDIEGKLSQDFDEYLVNSARSLLSESYQYLKTESARRVDLLVGDLERTFPRLSGDAIDSAYARAYMLLDGQNSEVGEISKVEAG